MRIVFLEEDLIWRDDSSISCKEVCKYFFMERCSLLYQKPFRWVTPHL